MNSTLADALQTSLGVDAVAFMPQFIVCAAIVLLLLIRLIPRYDRWHLGWIALALSVGACLRVSVPLFGGMLVYDNFSVFVNIFLYSFATLVVLLTLLTGIPDKEDSADFYCLLFGATLGMSL